MGHITKKMVEKYENDLKNGSKDIGVVKEVVLFLNGQIFFEKVILSNVIFNDTI